MKKLSKEEQIQIFGLKVGLYANIAWALFALFACVGIVVGNPKGIVIATVIAISWTLLRIMYLGVESLGTLKAVNIAQDLLKKQDEDQPKK